MNILVKNVLVVIYFKHCLLFKIAIQECSTGTRDGLCRPERDCLGFAETMSSASCSHGEVCCPQRTSSKERCYEYAAAVYKSDDNAINLMGISEEVKPENNCGILAAIPLIIGGEKAQPKEFPHMAAIGYGKNLETATWMCGGSLISETYILTAAHCLQSHFGEPGFVKLGVINVAKDEEDKNTQIYEIMYAISHPRYHPPSQWNDVALLRLSGEVEFTAYVRPACLDYSGTIKEETALATGWGLVELGFNEGSPDLMKVELDIIEKSVCNKIYKKALKGNVTDSLLCAGLMEGGKDTCQGDSGGPLQTVMVEPYCMYSVIGITSFGSFCGMVPSIYSRVFYYIPWIESVVWPDHQ